MHLFLYYPRHTHSSSQSHNRHEVLNANNQMYLITAKSGDN